MSKKGALIMDKNTNTGFCVTEAELKKNGKTLNQFIDDFEEQIASGKDNKESSGYAQKLKESSGIKQFLATTQKIIDKEGGKSNKVDKDEISLFLRMSLEHVKGLKACLEYVQKKTDKGGDKDMINLLFGMSLEHSKGLKSCLDYIQEHTDIEGDLINE